MASQPAREVTAPTHHDDKVARIAGQLRELAASRQPVHIAKSGVSHFVPLPGDRRFGGRPVDTADLDQILSIDPAARVGVAEPNVSFARLLRATLEHGLIPAVVPELEGITLGGAVAGCSVESMSYQVGGFHDTCLEYEVVTGAGEVLVTSREREPLLFEMLHGSYGTLGVLTRLTFRLLPAKPFVRMEYHRHRDLAAFEADLRERCRAADFDFVDGIIHGRDAFVLCLGRFVDSAPYTSDYRWLKVFYRSTRERREDFLTTYDYCFRYDTECHWLTRSVPGLETVPVRLVLGKLVLGSTNLITWSKRLDRLLGLKKRPDVVCDVFIPARRFAEFFDWYQRVFDFFPLWVIPYRIERPYPWVDREYAKGFGDELFIDCAVYGKPNSRPDVDFSVLLEEKTHELNGLKTLISRNHYSREKFWSVYDRRNYEAAKQRLDPGAVFPDLYDKFHRR